MEKSLLGVFDECYRRIKILKREIFFFSGTSPLVESARAEIREFIPRCEVLIITIKNGHTYDKLACV